MSIPNFQHNSTVFSQLAFTRSSSVPESIEIQIRIEIKIVDNASLPKQLQINLRAQTIDNEAIKFQVEAIGLFDYINNETAPTRKEKFDFARERGIHIIWPSIAHIVRLITSEMGIPPLNLRTPDISIMDELEQKYLAGDQSTS